MQCPYCKSRLVERHDFVYCFESKKGCGFFPMHKSLMVHARQKTVMGCLVRFRHRITNILIYVRHRLVGERL